MRYLVFDSEITGHHLEYLHHLYMEACQHKNDEFYFLTSNGFTTVKSNFLWPTSENVYFVFLSDKEQRNCDDDKLLRAAWYKSLTIRKYIKLWEIDRVWLIMFIQLMPFLPFLVPKRVRISGILYRIFLYDEVKFRGIRKYVEILRYRLFCYHQSIEHIFVLNDRRAVYELNEKFGVTKFCFLPDPVPSIDDNSLINIRKELGVRSEQQMFVHFGFIERRKGTLELLEAINLLNKDEIKSRFFVIAGQIKEDVRESFYKLYNQNRNKGNIKLIDKFCTYQFLNNLCYSCDAILIPYHKAIHSSGVIGYASYFKKTVIGPSEGLLGRLIRENELGMTISPITPQNIAGALLSELPKVNRKYADEHSIDEFVKVIFDTKR